MSRRTWLHVLEVGARLTSMGLVYLDLVVILKCERLWGQRRG